MDVKFEGQFPAFKDASQPEIKTNVIVDSLVSFFRKIRN